MVYIQSNNDKTMAHHFDCACAMWGTIESAMDYRFVTFEEVCSGKFDNLIRRNLFVGSVEFMTEVFKRVGIENVRVPINSNRKSETMTLGEAIDKTDVFIKPKQIKLFTGLVLDGCTNTCLETIPMDTEVLVYPALKDIQSEWRVYVHNGQISDSRNYSGDYMLSPDYDYVKYVAKDMLDMASHYTIDIGILGSGENVVIEFNDMWAIGNYGVPNDLYLRYLKDRYFEIIKS